MCDVRERREIRNVAERIADRLRIDELRIRLDRSAQRVRIVARHERALDAHALERDGKLRDGAAVQARGRDHVIAGLRQT